LLGAGVYRAEKTVKEDEIPTDNTDQKNGQRKFFRLFEQVSRLMFLTAKTFINRNAKQSKVYSKICLNFSFLRKKGKNAKLQLSRFPRNQFQTKPSKRKHLLISFLRVKEKMPNCNCPVSQEIYFKQNQVKGNIF
jgi:hypothetical protein